MNKASWNQIYMCTYKNDDVALIIVKKMLQKQPQLILLLMGHEKIIMALNLKLRNFFIRWDNKSRQTLRQIGKSKPDNQN